MPPTETGRRSTPQRRTVEQTARIARLTSISPATSNTTPTLSGATEPGATITIALKDTGGNTVGTLQPTVNASGGMLVGGCTTTEAPAPPLPWLRSLMIGLFALIRRRRD